MTMISRASDLAEAYSSFLQPSKSDTLPQELSYHHDRWQNFSDLGFLVNTGSGPLTNSANQLRIQSTLAGKAGLPFLLSAQHHFQQRRRQELYNHLIDEATGIKNRLLEWQRERRLKTVVFAGVNKNEGVAAVIANIANAFERTERMKLLLIDANFKTIGLSKYLGNLGLTRGLLDVLDDSATASTAVQCLPHSNIHFLSHGRKRKLPELLMRRGRLEALLRDFEREYDLVFVEAPPLRLFPDGYLWGQLAQSLILVIRPQRTLLPEVKLVQEAAKKQNVKILGNILNHRHHFATDLVQAWLNGIN